MTSARNEVAELISDCEKRVADHLRFSLNARKWRNVLEFLTIFLASSSTLAMPILAITGSDAITVAVVGNSFVFVSAIVGGLKQVFSFITLDYQHSNMSSEFAALASDLRAFQRRDPEDKHGFEMELEKLVAKHNGILARSNLQTVPNCPGLCCLM